jgi:nicotinamide mononucleotide (NMN) deamidase PncC
MLGFAIGEEVETETLRLSGSRADIRMDTVTAALEGLLARLKGAGE